MADNEVLSRVGMNKAVKQGRRLKAREEELLKKLEPFEKEKLFHIDQIEKVAKKYRLWFLYSYLYEGTVDKVLPEKIVEFEAKHKSKLDETDCYVLAPKESFRLEKKSKDPLFFV